MSPLKLLRVIRAEAVFGIGMKFLSPRRWRSIGTCVGAGPIRIAEDRVEVKGLVEWVMASQ